MVNIPAQANKKTAKAKGPSKPANHGAMRWRRDGCVNGDAIGHNYPANPIHPFLTPFTAPPSLP